MFVETGSHQNCHAFHLLVIAVFAIKLLMAGVRNTFVAFDVVKPAANEYAPVIDPLTVEPPPPIPGCAGRIAAPATVTKHSNTAAIKESLFIILFVADHHPVICCFRIEIQVAQAELALVSKLNDIRLTRVDDKVSGVGGPTDADCRGVRGG